VDFNHPDFAQSESFYTQQDDGRQQVGHIGEPLDLSRVADRSQRFAGFDENEEVDGKFHIWKVKPYSAYQSLLSAMH
jgi:alkaline phosphatase